MNNEQLPLLVGIVVGAIIGIFVARRSMREKPLHGGMPARIFHYMGASAFSGTFAASLTAIILRFPFLSILGTGLSFIAASLILLLLHAIFEAPAQPATADRDDTVWTAQKARESRL